MGDYTVILDVGETIKSVLWSSIEGSLFTEADIYFVESNIVLTGLKQTGQVDDTAKIKLFIFRVYEAPEMKNLPHEISTDLVSKPPPLYLTIDLLIIPNLEKHIDNLKLAGKIIEILHENPVVRVPFLTGSLKDTDAELKVIDNPISLDDLTKLWTSFPETSLQLSLSYKITNIPLDPTREEELVPVKEVELGYGEKVKNGGSEGE